MRELTFLKGHCIFKEGDDSSQGIFLIRKGKVEISKVINGEEVTLAILEAGAIFGEMSLLSGDPRSATATVLEDTQCLTASPNEFTEQLNNVAPFVQSVFKAVVKRTGEITQRYTELQATMNKLV